MPRTLYRFYLYTVSILLLGFATGIAIAILTTLLALTPLRGNSDAPGQAEIVQSIVFALVGWIISGGLLGLHYWLIRRDMESDPEAETSAIRAFYLNAAEAVGVLIIVPLVGLAAIGGWTTDSGTNLSNLLGLALALLAMVLLLELERRRTPTDRGMALIFKRFHFFSVQLQLLLITVYVLFDNLRTLASTLLFGGQFQNGFCGTDPCQTPRPFGLILTMLWFVFCWLVYCWLTRTDASRNTRLIVHGIGLAIGIASLLAGLFTAFEVLLTLLYQMPLTLSNVLGTEANYDFVTPLLIGLLVAGVYHFLLRLLPQKDPADRIVRRQTEQAITGILLAGTFWAGIGYGFYNLLQLLAPAHSLPSSNSWITIIALVLTGLAHMLLDHSLRQQFARDAVNSLGARRGFVLALLGVGILTLAVAGVTTLYAWGTALLHAPISSWQHIAHIGLAGTFVGAIITGIYLWSARREQLLSNHTQPAPTPVPPAPGEAAVIEDVLDELLAKQITREEARTRLEQLQQQKAVDQQSSVPLNG